MKKTIIPFAILISFSINLNAQTYQPFPTGEATWEVTRCWYFYDPGWYDSYTFSMDGTDTLYNGEVFKKIYITNHHLPGTIHDTIYPIEFFGGIRESNKQVFIYQMWASVDTSVLMVYDFSSTNVGDTIYTNVLSGNPNLFGHLVTATDSVLVGSTYHKRLHLADVNNSYNTEYWIEGIGSSWGLPFATFWSITDNSYDLSCFYKNENLQYENPSPTYGFCQAPPSITCEIISSVETGLELKTQLFEIFPNPAAEEINLVLNMIDFKGATLNIYDFTGKIVQTLVLDKSNTLIRLENLSNGVYVSTINIDGHIESKKLIIQK